MKSEVLKYVIYAQACFYIGLLICIAIRPAGLAANGGISYYGVYRNTIIFYSIAFIGSGLFSIRAGLNISDTTKILRVLRIGLISIGLLSLGVLLTPDTLSSFMDGLHRGFGATLFIEQLLISFFVCVTLKYDRAIVFLIAVEFAGGLASYFYLAPAHGLLLQSQVLFQLAFSAILIYSLPKLAEKTS